MAASFGSKRLALTVLLCASFFFYGLNGLDYVFLLAGSIVINYYLGKILRFTQAHDTYKNLVLLLGVGGNLLFLAVCKYSGILSLILNRLAGTDIPVLNVSMTLGLSFFTLQQIAYLIDVWRLSLKKNDSSVSHSLLEYASFVSFFPQLTLGPIVLAREFFTQIRKKRFLRLSSIGFSTGITYFVIGLFKKVVLADRMAIFANAVFDSELLPGEISGIDVWVGVIAYSLQIYFDFSGYSDMAIGLGRMFGIKLPYNFSSPYQASSIIDFWRRWHITLSRFLRDYLYIPLGGNRKGEMLRVRNIMVTMLLGGLWHGAGYTFILWGGLHGVFIVVNHLWRRLGICLPNWLGTFLTFVCVTLAWVFFRAKSVSQAVEILAAMAIPDVALQSVFGTQSLLGTGLFLLGLFLALAFKNSQQYSLAYYRNPLVPVGMALMLGIVILRISIVESFIYDEF